MSLSSWANLCYSEPSKSVRLPRSAFAEKVKKIMLTIKVKEKLKELYFAQSAIPKLLEDESIPEQSWDKHYIPIRLHAISKDFSHEKTYLKRKEIDMSSIFSDGKRKIVVLGPAGAGKSTLFYNIAYKWGKSELMDQFDFVFILKLKLLPEYLNSYESKNLLESFIYRYLESQTYLNLSLEDVVKVLQNHNEKILLLLDGYNEMGSFTWGSRSKQYNKIIEQILKYHVIISSRPNCLKEEDTEKFDRIVECDGLEFSGIRNYICAYFQSPETEEINLESNASSLIGFLERSSNVRNMVGIPLNLVLLCLVWSDKESRESLQQTNIDFTLTYLYDQIILWLGKRYLTNFKTKEPCNVSRGMIWKDPIMSFLKGLAYNSFVNNSIMGNYIKAELINEHTDKSNLDIRDVLDFGLITKINDYKSTKLLKLDYQFIHSTFQEYLAAHETLGRLTIDPEETSSFIGTNRNQPKYLIYLKFLTGLLTLEKVSDELFVLFWDAICCNLDEMLEIGIGRKIVLLMHLLEQSYVNGEYNGKNPHLERMKVIIDEIVMNEGIKVWAARIIESEYLSPQICRMVADGRESDDDILKISSTNIICSLFYKKSMSERWEKNALISSVLGDVLVCDAELWEVKNYLLEKIIPLIDNNMKIEQIGTLFPLLNDKNTQDLALVAIRFILNCNPNLLNHVIDLLEKSNKQNINTGMALEVILQILECFNTTTCIKDKLIEIMFSYVECDDNFDSARVCEIINFLRSQPDFVHFGIIPMTYFIGFKSTSATRKPKAEEAILQNKNCQDNGFVDIFVSVENSCFSTTCAKFFSSLLKQIKENTSSPARDHVDYFVSAILITYHSGVNGMLISSVCFEVIHLLITELKQSDPLSFYNYLLIATLRKFHIVIQLSSMPRQIHLRLIEIIQKENDISGSTKSISSMFDSSYQNDIIGLLRKYTGLMDSTNEETMKRFTHLLDGLSDFLISNLPLEKIQQTEAKNVCLSLFGLLLKSEEPKFEKDQEFIYVLQKCVKAIETISKFCALEVRLEILKFLFHIFKKTSLPALAYVILAAITDMMSKLLQQSGFLTMFHELYNVCMIALEQVELDPRGFSGLIFFTDMFTRGIEPIISKNPSDGDGGHKNPMVQLSILFQSLKKLIKSTNINYLEKCLAVQKLTELAIKKMEIAVINLNELFKFYSEIIRDESTPYPCVVETIIQFIMLSKNSEINPSTDEVINNILSCMMEFVKKTYPCRLKKIRVIQGFGVLSACKIFYNSKLKLQYENKISEFLLDILMKEQDLDQCLDEGCGRKCYDNEYYDEEEKCFINCSNVAMKILIQLNTASSTLEAQRFVLIESALNIIISKYNEKYYYKTIFETVPFMHLSTLVPHITHSDPAVRETIKKALIHSTFQNSYGSTNWTEKDITQLIQILTTVSKSNNELDKLLHSRVSTVVNKIIEELDETSMINLLSHNEINVLYGTRKVLYALCHKFFKFKNLLGVHGINFIANCRNQSWLTLTIIRKLDMYEIYFDGTFYKFERNEKMDFSLNMLACKTLLESCDMLGKQYTEHNPLFPKIGNCMRVAACDLLVSSLLNGAVLLSPKSWLISKVCANTENQKNFMLIETRDFFGYLVIYKILNESDANECYTIHPEMLDTKFREKIFGTLNYSNIEVTYEYRMKVLNLEQQQGMELSNFVKLSPVQLNFELDKIFVNGPDFTGTCVMSEYLELSREMLQGLIVDTTNRLDSIIATNPTHDILTLQNDFRKISNSVSTTIREREQDFKRLMKLSKNIDDVKLSLELQRTVIFK